MLKFVALPIFLLWTCLFAAFFTLGLLVLIADYIIEHAPQDNHPAI